MPEEDEGKLMLVPNGGCSFKMFVDKLVEVPQEKGLLVNTSFNISVEELPEGPEREILVCI